MAPMSTSTHRLRLGLEDLLEQPLRTVPVEIAPGADSLEVRLRYDRRQATVDLGCEGPAGWRGWSGGARDHFVIAAGTATPGYLPGPGDRKSTRLNSRHVANSYAGFCLQEKT